MRQSDPIKKLTIGNQAIVIAVAEDLKSIKYAGLMFIHEYCLMAALPCVVPQ
jgi:hypothetical protein